MANDCEEEKSYVSLDPRFVKKLSLTTVRIHDTLSFFFSNRCMEFLGEGERESHRYLWELKRNVWIVKRWLIFAIIKCVVTTECIKRI